MGKSELIYHPSQLAYRFPAGHPFNQRRLELTVSLLEAAGALRAEDLIAPQAASLEELELAHAKAYVAAVQTLSRRDDPALAEAYGFSADETPRFAGMHEAAALAAGGSILACERVMDGRAEHAFHPGGGLHHALAAQAAGFCIYNDAAVAIAWLRRRYGARVLYVDTDVHHGDGVQWAFYSDPDVCVFSIHETGKYLFPGTGEVAERGEGEGFGWTVNLPLEPYTEDASWLECFAEGLERVAAAFRPDLIVSQHGCDAHAFDPLAHLQCTMGLYRSIPRLLHRTAHSCCQGRWVALGGGGYDIWRVVPRAWGLVWLEMSGSPLLADIDAAPALPLPEAWRSRWQKATPTPLPSAWLDDQAGFAAMPRRKEIEARNRVMKELALLYLPEASVPGTGTEGGPLSG
ncbi:acetoin utilization protein AcuC [Gorillibacterium sp. sgz500922]|uniref:acetoin utilization protein AcuC n=1 Tax=Gorillibacterium sp. sgz500922 TaxID=3446694 RepID=UPI003F6667E9